MHVRGHSVAPDRPERGSLDTSGGLGDRSGVASSVSRQGWRRALRNVLRVGPTSSERRLRGDIADLEAELNRRALKGDAAAQPDWSKAARSLLENAEAAINDGNLATGYANLLSAQREVIWSYGPTEIVAAQVSLREETGDDKIGGWRARAINGLVAEIGWGHPQLLGQLEHRRGRL